MDPKAYRIYVDESGDHTYRRLDDTPGRYFGLTGIIVEAEVYTSAFQPSLEALKKKHFPNHPDEPPVVLHRADMIEAKRAFWPLRDAGKRAAWDNDILAFLVEHHYRLITVVIDKKSHTERYGEAAFHPYDFCLTMMLERYCGYLRFLGTHGDVMIEQRGKTEDAQLQAAYNKLCLVGTQFHPGKFFADVLTSKDIKFRRKEANIAGLQVSDLLAYPSKQEILHDNRCITALTPFEAKVKSAIAGKYNRQVYRNRITGYGKVFLK